MKMYDAIMIPKNDAEQISITFHFLNDFSVGVLHDFYRFKWHNVNLSKSKTVKWKHNTIEEKRKKLTTASSMIQRTRSNARRLVYIHGQYLPSSLVHTRIGCEFGPSPTLVKARTQILYSVKISSLPKTNSWFSASTETLVASWSVWLGSYLT